MSRVRVLDFTALVQGPLATQMLGDLGADVVKIERMDGEWSRHWGIADGHTHGQTDSFLAFNRNKRSVTADLKDPATRAKILEMAKDFDVVVENFRPGVMASLGLGYDEFSAVNPGIIVTDSSAFGPTGPWARRLGYGPLVRASAAVRTDPASSSALITESSTSDDAWRPTPRPSTYSRPIPKSSASSRSAAETTGPSDAITATT